MASGSGESPNKKVRYSERPPPWLMGLNTRSPRIAAIHEMAANLAYNSVHQATTVNQLSTIGADQFVGDNRTYHDIGDPLYQCPHCFAFMWYDERTNKNKGRYRPQFSLCCMHGKVSLDKLPEPPKLLQSLLVNRDKKSKNFREHIRAYNTMFAFTSLGGKVDNSINTQGGPYVFKMHGQNYHRIGSLLPLPGESPKFAQLYIHDTENETTNRISAVSSSSGPNCQRRDALRRDIVDSLRRMLDRCNPYVEIFRMAKERFKTIDGDDLKLCLIASRNKDHRSYNLPDVSEVAALFVGDLDESLQPRDIVLETRQRDFIRITEVHPVYLPLQYPLLFPYGEDGYHLDLELKKKTTMSTKPRVKISLREFMAYRLQERSTEPATILLSRKLFQQFIVDGFTMVECERISYLKKIQEILLSENYSSISATVENGNSVLASIGSRVILPSSVTGGARYMKQNYLDAMTLCKHFGYPNLFITFTCNPKWPEVERFLRLRNLSSEDCPDIMVRIFKLKLDHLILDMRRNNIFGVAKAVIYTIEFQRKGLLHAHILLFLQRKSKFPTSQEIDAIISAQIPDRDRDPLLYKVVEEIMVHGPCENANRISLYGWCDDDGYPIYKRPNDGRFVMKRGVKLDNRFIVPYNSMLLLRYRAHINVKWCNQARAIKYLFKHINKEQKRVTGSISFCGFDNASKNGKVVDEIKNYLDCRYVSSCEASWRIFGFDIHYRSVPVERLRFHLEGEQNVVFSEDDLLDEVVELRSAKCTMFTEWFRCNATYSTAKLLSYVEFPAQFVWNKKTRKWTPRQKGYAVGRINHVPPSVGEAYYLRILLNKIKGPTSYQDLRTVNGIIYSTYKDACYALGLLNDDKEYVDALKEANHWASAPYIRSLFVVLLSTESLSRPEHVWKETWELLSNDILNKKRKMLNLPSLEMSAEQIKNDGLLEIEKSSRRNGSSLKRFDAMPIPVDNETLSGFNKLISEELCYDIATLKQEHERLKIQLTDEQKTVFVQIMESVLTDAGGIYFVYGYGGTGKTYIWRTLASAIRSQGEIVLNVASSGIASLLLEGGRTAHSRFAIPIDVNKDSTCSIKLGTDLAELIKKTKLIIWDEAPMMHKHCFEALDKSIRDIMGSVCSSFRQKLFGGKTIVFGGDFRQILPIVQKGTRQDIVRAALNSSYIWNYCKLMKLTKNLRLATGSQNQDVTQTKAFQDWILKLGDGCLSEPNDGICTIQIPQNLLIMTTGDPIDCISQVIYEDLDKHCDDFSYFQKRAILCPTNEIVDIVNDRLLNVMPGEVKEYLSSNSICQTQGVGDDINEVYNTEFLNAIKAPGLPNHKLRLKIGIPIMLLRNIDLRAGLCNGTRLQIT